MDPISLLIRVLDKLGVNTTKLRWKLYRVQQRSQQVRRQGALPPALRWIQYPHKICRHCGAVADREAGVCRRCERKLPSMTGYRAARILGIMMPDEAPVTVTAFLAVIVLVFGVMMALDGLGGLWSPSIHILILLGAWTSDQGLNPQDLWRILGFGLVHGGIIHIGFNAFATSQIGPIIESQIGRKKMMVVITLCQLCAAFATLFWYTTGNRPFLTVGASGWVFGLIGFGVAYFHLLGDRGKMHRDFLLRWAIYGILFGLLVGANNAAHIGGMAGGALLGFLCASEGRASRPKDTLWELAFWTCTAVWTITLGFLFHSVITGLL